MSLARLRALKRDGGLQNSTPDELVAWAFGWWLRLIDMIRSLGKEVAIPLTRGSQVSAATISRHINVVEAALRDSTELRRQAQLAPPHFKAALEAPAYLFGTFAGSAQQQILVFPLIVNQTVLFLVRWVREWSSRTAVGSVDVPTSESIDVKCITDRMQALALDAMLQLVELIEERRGICGLEVVQHLSPLTGVIHVIDVRTRSPSSVILRLTFVVQKWATMATTVPCAELGGR